MQAEVIKKEAAFADAEYASCEGRLEIDARMLEKYAAPRQLWDWRQLGGCLLGNIAGKSVLEVGCGIGEEAVYLAQLGAEVTAIDISEVGIRITRKRAEFNRLGDRVTAQVMSATPTDFAPETFDVVHGIGILHHVGLEEGLMETRRVLKPGGTGLFLEPMGNSPLVEGLKKRIMRRWGHRLGLGEVTENEENLRYRDLVKYRSRFSHFRLYPYHLLTRVRKLILPRRMHDCLRILDYYTLKVAPFMRYFAGAVVIHLSK
jgi:SAM-dependent methyltransferase